jgi:Cof subfamily protein (haloacid dehalogenase superfamily)
MIKLVLTDLDDTLIPVGSDGASPRAIAAIHAMLDEGLYFGPLSGRIPDAMGWMFRGDAVCCQTGAYVNGQILCADGDVVRTITIDAEPLNRVAEYLEGVYGAYLVVYDPFDAESLYAVTPHAERLEGVTLAHDRQIVQTARRIEDPQVVKTNILCDFPYERILQLRDDLAERFPELSFVMPSRFARIIDILPQGWSKGAAVLALAELLGIAPDEVAVFGDSENDLSMIEAVPNSVAVANASPEVKAAARWHIGASADDAVALALEQIAAAAPTASMPAFMHD